MAIDPSIPLQVKTPTIETPDFTKSLTDAYKIKAAQLDIAKAQNEEEYKLLASATPENYGQVRQVAVQKYGPDADKMLPPVYDKAAIDNLSMSRLDIKDKLSLAQKQHEMQMEDDKFDETKRHNKATEGMFGNSVEGKSMNILMGGNTDDPAYALAMSKLTQPQIKPVTQPDGSIQLVAVTPELPPQFKKPGIVAPNPQSIVGSQGLMPPSSTGVKGTIDPTPSTPSSQLLPAPSAPVRGFSVQPIAGTQGAPKLTDDQTKAAGFADRTQASHQIINQLSDAGYAPSIATDSLGESKLGNSALTAQGQQFVQAKRDFVNALLRRESGAAISESEFSNANKQYFPQPGDKTEVLAQKKQNRELAIESLKRSAGNGYKPSEMAAQSTIPHSDIDAELAKRGVK